MKCQFCNDEIAMEHKPDEFGAGIWILSCRCVETRHPYFEKAMELHKRMCAVNNKTKEIKP
jgi:hypothetical protein